MAGVAAPGADANVAVVAGRPVTRSHLLREQVNGDPTNPLLRLMLAEELSSAGDRDGAAHEFRAAAPLLYYAGRRDEAIIVLDRLLHHAPDPGQAKFCAALYLARGNPSDGMHALAKLQIAFQHDVRDPDTLALLVRAFEAIGQPAKAAGVSAELARVRHAQRESLEPPPPSEFDVLDPAHFALFTALVPGLKREALSTIGMGRPREVKMSSQLLLTYSIEPNDGGHHHHAALSFGPWTPREVGASYLLLFLATLGVPWRAARFGCSDSGVHHAQFGTKSLAHFAEQAVVPVPLGAMLDDARSAPVAWERITFPRASSAG